MKKITLILITLLFITSCGSSRDVVRDARRTLSGEWTLNNIIFPANSNVLDVTLFNDATAACLRNSDWDFVSNNNTGSYTVTNPNCTTHERYFIWSVNEEGEGDYDFMLKPTNADYESTTGNQGYRLNLVEVAQDEMVWEQTVMFEGNPFTITMEFNKK